MSGGAGRRSDRRRMGGDDRGGGDRQRARRRHRPAAQPGRDRQSPRLPGRGDDPGQPTGLRAIVDSAMVSYERLPMLEIVFDRLVRLLTTSLRNFFSDNVEVSLSDITSVRFGDYINSIPLPTILAVFRAEEWDNFGLITVDSTLAYSVIDVLLGGRRSATVGAPGRPALFDRSRPASCGACSISSWPTPSSRSSRCRRCTSTSTASRPIRASPRSRGPPTPRS